LVIHLIRCDMAIGGYSPEQPQDLAKETTDMLTELSFISFQAGLDPRDLGEAIGLPQEMLARMPKTYARPEEG
jgi:pyrroline-5-carboxylate reductase